MRLANLFKQREINRLAYPAILAGIAEPVISLVDTAFVGQLGTIPLAAVGIAGSFYTMMVWILAQTLTAIAAIISKKFGQNKLEEVQSLVPQALISNIFLGLAIFFLTSEFSDTIFSWYNAEGKILEACTEYFAVRSIGFPFTLATLLLFGVFRGLQNTSWAMYVAISGAVLNIVLDYVLIFGFPGVVDAMGLTGAALASLISQITMFILGLAILLIKTPFNLAIKFKINPYFRELMGMSFDLFVRTILLNLTFYLATRYATGYGKAVIAAHTIALNIWLFSSFFIDGFAHAGNAMAGRYLGESNDTALGNLGKSIGKISLFIGVILAAIYAILYPFLIHFFTDDPQVIDQFQRVFWLVILTQPINALAFAFDGIYKGLGYTKLLRNLLIASTLLVFVPIAGGFHYIQPSLMGIWIAFLGWMCCRSFYLLYDFKKRFSL
jgi:putative MATE family efflux protein